MMLVSCHVPFIALSGQMGHVPIMALTCVDLILLSTFANCIVRADYFINVINNAKKMNFARVCDRMFWLIVQSRNNYGSCLWLKGGKHITCCSRNSAFNPAVLISKSRYFVKINYSFSFNSL